MGAWAVHGVGVAISVALVVRVAGVHTDMCVRCGGARRAFTYVQVLWCGLSCACGWQGCLCLAGSVGLATCAGRIAWRRRGRGAMWSCEQTRGSLGRRTRRARQAARGVAARTELALCRRRTRLHVCSFLAAARQAVPQRACLALLSAHHARPAPSSRASSRARVPTFPRRAPWNHTTPVLHTIRRLRRPALRGAPPARRSRHAAPLS